MSTIKLKIEKMLIEKPNMSHDEIALICKADLNYVKTINKQLDKTLRKYLSIKDIKNHRALQVGDVYSTAGDKAWLKIIEIETSWHILFSELQTRLKIDWKRHDTGQEGCHKSIELSEFLKWLTEEI